MPKRAIYVISCICFLFLFGCHSLKGPLVNELTFDGGNPHIVEVRVTSQSYQLHRPWQRLSPVTQTAIGVVLEKNRVLVTASILADHRYIELAIIGNDQKSPAKVECIDYETNLALLSPVDKDFLKEKIPLAIDGVVKRGANLTVWQIKPNGETIPAVGTVTSVDLSTYPFGNVFLSYRLNVSIQYQYGYASLPVVSNNKLVGLIMSHSIGSQSSEIIPGPIINHFLMDANDGSYRGFPTAGFRFGTFSDPGMRGYLKIPESIRGVYVEDVVKGGPADRSGMKPGDIITKAGNYHVDNESRYLDPSLGSMPLVHLIRSVYDVGDVVPFEIYRKGESLSINVTLDHRSPGEYLVPPFIIDQKPRYYILAGLVIQELSTSYLREYGGDWQASAPIHLVFYNQNQDYLTKESREKIVFLSSVLPTSYTIGYEQFSDIVISRINGRTIGKLEDIEEALKKPVNGFHKMEFEHHPKVLYLDPDEISKIDEQVKEKYNISGSLISL